MFRIFTGQSERPPAPEQCSDDGDECDECDEKEFSAQYSDEEDGCDEKALPAQLHQEYTPPSDRRKVSTENYHGAAAVDIVLVHGLGSKYETTWAHKREDGSRYHWIREQLPKDMPDARILGFEYPSRWYDDPVATSLTECASQLLRSLIQDRCHTNAPEMCRAKRTRPIILVGHSFGGLVIKQAMVMASQILSSNSPRVRYENNRDVLSAIAGVVFLGTPHRGSGFAALAGWKMSLGSYLWRVKSNDEIITILKPDSYVLNELQRTFAQLRYDERMLDLKLVCYYELRAVPYLNRMVVSQSSASLDGAECHGVDTNHMDMNAFCEGDNGKHDGNYGHFIADIRGISHSAPSIVSKRFDKWVYGSDAPDANRERLQRWLDPSRDVQTITYMEKLDIQRAAPYTCQWIHKTQEFNSWKSGSEPANNALWISGTAGSGKSVLAAYVINALKNDAKKSLGHTPTCVKPISEPCEFSDSSIPVLMFFCGVDRKSETTDRMLATLVHQLLLARPQSQELFNIAEEMYKETLKGEEAWCSTLARYFARMALVAGPVFIVIDNLEDIPQPALLLEKLSILGAVENVRLLIFSQETDQIAHALEDHFRVQKPLFITDHSSQDIKQFTDLHGAALMTARPHLLDKKDFIMKTLHERAQGMFQWVNSALEELRSLVDPRDVETKLNGIRGHLTQTYDKIFERMLADRDDAEKRRIQLALKWIAGSATPVTAVDLKIAHMIQERILQRDQDPNKGRATIEAESDIRRMFESEESREVAEREAKKYLGTIVNVQSDGTLQFKHTTYLRALTTPDGALTPASTLKFRLSDAHRDIALICMTVCQTTTFIHANSFITWRMPLVQYTWSFWAYHCNKAATGFTTAEDGAQLCSLLQAYPAMQGDLDKQQAFQTAFNRMIDGTTRDTVLYLEAMIDFLSRPLRAVSGRFSDREYVLSLQRAQESLIQPTKDLCTLRRSLFDPISSRLQHITKSVKKAADQPCPKSTAETLQNKASDRVSGAVGFLIGLSPSTVTKLSIDSYLETNPSLPRPYGAPRLLLEIARNIRVTALRLAVDPIYSALLLTAGGKSFSPLHPLVYIAQLLEEAGRYPYWDALPPGTDVMEPFICATQDSEFPSAKFVLHCFQWREPQLTRADANMPYPPTPTSLVTARPDFTAHYAPSAIVHIDMRPSPGSGGRGIGLNRVSTENWEQVKRLHQMKSAHFFAAQETYALFRSDKDWLNQSVLNPMMNLHMRFSLAVEEHTNVSLYKEDAASILGVHYAPDEVREAPLRTYIIAIPYTIRSYFIQYIVLLFESFGQIGTQVLTMHWVKVEAALKELSGVKSLWRRLLPGNRGGTVDIQGNLIPPVNPIFLVPALVLFYLRCLYLPSWGAYMWYHSWSKFHYAWNHPATYLAVQREVSSGFWHTLWVIFLGVINVMIGETAIALTQLPPELTKKWIGGAVSTYALFHSFCTVDRSMFGIVASMATLLACCKMMLYDIDTVAQVLRFSFFFWFTVFVQMVASMIKLGALERGGGWVAVLGGAFLQVFTIVVCCIYCVPISQFLWSCAKPGRWLAVWIWTHWLSASIVAAKAIGMACLLMGVWKAYWYMHKFLWDPHDIEGSLKQLLEASQLIRATLGVSERTNQLVASGARPGDLKRVGWYPLGNRQTGDQVSKKRADGQLANAHLTQGPVGASLGVTETACTTALSASLLHHGPPRAETALHRTTQSLNREMSEGLSNTVVGLQRYVESDTGLKRDAKRLGNAVDAAVLASGDGLGWAVDRVLTGAQDMGIRAIEAASETPVVLKKATNLSLVGWKVKKE